MLGDTCGFYLRTVMIIAQLPTFLPQTVRSLLFWVWYVGFPGGVVVKNPPANARDKGDVGSVPGLARSPGVGKTTLSSG